MATVQHRRGVKGIKTGHALVWYFGREPVRRVDAAHRELVRHTWQLSDRRPRSILVKFLSQFSPSRESSFAADMRAISVAAIVVLAIGLGTTAATVVWLRQDANAKASTRFDRLVDRVEVELTQLLNLPFFGLKGAAGVYAASQSVQRAEFRAYVESSRVSQDYPGMRGFGFIAYVKRQDLPAFVAAQRKDKSPDFHVTSRSEVGDLYIVKFIEPEAFGKNMLGVDVGQDPTRRQAIDRAVLTGQATLSGRTALFHDERVRPALVYLLPVFRRGQPLLTANERQTAFLGVLVAPVVIEDSVADTVASIQGLADLELFDSAGDVPASSEHLLFDLDGHLSRAAPGVQDKAYEERKFRISRVISVGGRALTLRMSSTPGFNGLVASSLPALAGAAGSLLSILLALSVWLLGSGRARALMLARRMTADLASERQRLTNIVEGTNAGTWVWDVQTGELQVDERWAAMIGYGAGMLDPVSIATWRDRVHPEDIFRVQMALGRHFSGELDHFECESRIRHRDGQWVWALDRGKVSTWTPLGKPQLTAGTHMDISDRQAAQLALQASEDHFRHLFENSLDGILQALPDGSVLYANPAACQMLGLTQAEIRQRGRGGLMDPEDSRFHIFMGQALMTGQARGQLTMIRGDGSRFECELSSSLYLSRSGESCTNIFLRDVTKRKMAEAEISALNDELEDRVRRRTAQLEAANKELEAFSYSVAHDLRSPLNSIDGFSHLLAKAISANKPERSNHYVDRIRAGVRQMGALTDGLLALAHLSRAKLRAETVDISAIADRVLQDFRERDVGRVVRTHVTRGLSAVGDPALLHQVMENLIGNAWKFTGNGAVAEIWVGSTSVEAEAVVYFVKDNGAGFDMAYADKLFGTFERLHSPDEFPGTGIGLATSHRIVTRHGGRIWADGHVGKGASFYFTIPRAVKQVRSL